MNPLHVAARFQRETLGVQAAVVGNLEVTLKATLDVLESLKPWLGQFPGVLRQAEQEAEGLPSGLVWQNRFVRFFEDADVFEARLRDLEDKLASVYFTGPEGPTNVLANKARVDLRQPRKARIGYAIENPQFYDHPKLGKDYIAYDVRSLKEWAQAYGKWLTDATRAIQAHLKKASKLT